MSLVETPFAEVHVLTTGLRIFAGPDQTEAWANRPGLKWPLSKLSGRKIDIELDRDFRIIDVAVDSLQEPYPNTDSDIPADELNAFIDDILNIA